MDPNTIEITIKDLHNMVKKIGISNPSALSANELLDVINKYQQNRCKTHHIHKGFRDLGLINIAKKQNLTYKDLHEATRLNNKPLEDLRKLAKLRRIKNYNDLTKEQLIYILLRLEKHHQENLYEKYITINTDDEINEKINDVRILVSQLGNIITKEQRKEIKEKLYEIEDKKLTKIQKERALDYLINLLNNLNISEKYQYNDYDDLDYFGLRDIGTLFGPVDNYYKPILTKISFKNKYQYYETKGDKNKNLSVKQYIATILPELAKLINERKTSSEDEQKAQFIMSIRFRDDTDNLCKK